MSLRCLRRSGLEDDEAEGAEWIEGQAARCEHHSFDLIKSSKRTS